MFYFSNSVNSRILLAEFLLYMPNYDWRAFKLVRIENHLKQSSSLLTNILYAALVDIIIRYVVQAMKYLSMALFHVNASNRAMHL